MNNSELDSLLKKAKLPETPAESLELFPRRVISRLKRPDPACRSARPLLLRLGWAMGLACCLFIAFALGHRSGQVAIPAGREADSLADAKLIHETLAMFPNQVRAITEDGQGLKLVLSQDRDVPASPPIYVRICDGKNCASMVTFSGQEIRIAGQTLTVLADSNGGIILTGNRFVWSNAGPIHSDNHLRIEAKNLGPAAM